MTSLLRVTTVGAVVDSVEARGGIRVSANNVTIRRSMVDGIGGGEGAGIYIDAGISGTTIVDVEVTSRSGVTVDRAMQMDGTFSTTILRAYTHNTIRGIRTGCSTTIVDSFVFGENAGNGQHRSTVGGETCPNKPYALTVRHNHIQEAPTGVDSAALLIYPPQSAPYGPAPQQTDITLVDNELAGGSYAMWLSSDPTFTGNLTVTGNRFRTTYFPTCGQYGQLFSDHVKTEGHFTITWSDNDGVPAPTV